MHGWDHRGHGQSPGRRGDIPDHDPLLRDTASLVDAVRRPGMPFVLPLDRLVHDRITARTTRFIVDAGEHVIANAPRWRLRTLLMWAGADRCVAPRGSEAFAAAAPAAVVATRPWPGRFHELFNEPEQAEVLRVLTDWLKP